MNGTRWAGHWAHCSLTMPSVLQSAYNSLVWEVLMLYFLVWMLFTYGIPSYSASGSLLFFVIEKVHESATVEPLLKRVRGLQTPSGSQTRACTFPCVLGRETGTAIAVGLALVLNSSAPLL